MPKGQLLSINQQATKPEIIIVPEHNHTMCRQDRVDLLLKTKKQDATFTFYEGCDTIDHNTDDLDDITDSVRADLIFTSLASHFSSIPKYA